MCRTKAKVLPSSFQKFIAAYQSTVHWIAYIAWSYTVLLLDFIVCFCKVLLFSTAAKCMQKMSILLVVLQVVEAINGSLQRDVSCSHIHFKWKMDVLYPFCNMWCHLQLSREFKQSAHPRYAVYILEADIQLSLSLSLSRSLSSSLWQFWEVDVCNPNHSLLVKSWGLAQWRVCLLNINHWCWNANFS